MKELDKSYYSGEYCTCCGRKIDKIWKFLNKQKSIPMRGTIGKGRKEWKGHTLYKDGETFYEGLTLKHCAGCGEELSYEEINSSFESRGECHGFPCSEEIVTGYKCEKCGHDEVF